MNTDDVKALGFWSTGIVDDFFVQGEAIATVPQITAADANKAVVVNAAGSGLILQEQPSFADSSAAMLTVRERQGPDDTGVGSLQLPDDWRSYDAGFMLTSYAENAGSTPFPVVVKDLDAGDITNVNNGGLRSDGQARVSWQESSKTFTGHGDNILSFYLVRLGGGLNVDVLLDNPSPAQTYYHLDEDFMTDYQFIEVIIEGTAPNGAATGANNSIPVSELSADLIMDGTGAGTTLHYSHLGTAFPPAGGNVPRAFYTDGGSIVYVAGIK